MPMFTVKWPSLKALLTVLLVCWSPLSLAIGSDALWLPASYNHLMVGMRKAALAVEEDERCVKILRGKMHPRGTKDNPLYLMTCRGQDRRTFTVEVEPVTHNMKFQIDRVVEVKGFNEKRIAAAWQKCSDQLQQKTRFMRNMKPLYQGRPTPDLSEVGAVNMIADFDAENLHGKPLHYRATCSASNEQPAMLKIGPRPQS